MTAPFMFLDDCVALYARIQAAETALEFKGRKISWDRLDRLVDQVAHMLVNEGVLPGDFVAFLGRNSDFTLVLMFAVARIRATFLPVNWRLSPPEVAFILSDSGARFVITSREFLPLLTEGANVEVSTRKIVVENRCDEFDGADLWEHRTEPGRRQPQSDVDAERLVAVLLYTSGTTGAPKGAMLSHAYFTRGARMFLDHPEMVLRLDPGEQALVCLPMFHVGGLNFCFVLLSQGRGLVILDDYDPSTMLDLIDTGRIALSTGVPTMLQVLLDHPKASETDFSGLRYFVYGAAPMPAPLIERAMKRIGCGFASMYGLTESSGVTYLAPSDHSAQGNELMLSVGKPFSGVELRIIDPEGRSLPVGETGEIVIRSPQLLLGYWNQPEATSQCFVEGWFRTGDGASVDAAGYVHLKDRIKDMIASGGENIYPAEVEKILCRHPSIREIVVVGIPDERWGETPKAFALLNDGATLTLEDLRAFAAPYLARYKLPRQLEVVSTLPRTPSGKVLKRQLRAGSGGQGISDQQCGDVPVAFRKVNGEI